MDVLRVVPWAVVGLASVGVALGIASRKRQRNEKNREKRQKLEELLQSLPNISKYRRMSVSAEADPETTIMPPTGPPKTPQERELLLGILKANPLLQHLDDDHLARVTDYMQQQIFDDNAIIIRQGMCCICLKMK